MLTAFYKMVIIHANLKKNTSTENKIPLKHYCPIGHKFLILAKPDQEQLDFLEISNQLMLHIKFC